MTPEEIIESQRANLAEHVQHYGTLLRIITDIRMKTGIGSKPMLSELADAIAAKFADLQEVSESRLKSLHEKADECRAEWKRAENAEAYAARLRNMLSDGGRELEESEQAWKRRALDAEEEVKNLTYECAMFKAMYDGLNSKRLCVMCGKEAPADRIPHRGEHPDCPFYEEAGGKLCMFDMTEREALEHWMGEAHRERERADAAEANASRLRAALRYYADFHGNPNEGPWGVSSDDFGNVARSALAADAEKVRASNEVPK